MCRMLHQTCSRAYAVTFVARRYNITTSTRSIHNFKLVGLHSQLHQPAPEVLRLHGLRLHGPVISTVVTGQVQKKVDVEFYKVTLQNIKLVHLHNTLYKPPVEKLSFGGLFLHNHEKYLQWMNQISLETIAVMVSPSTSGPKIVTKRHSNESKRLSVASVQDTPLATEKFANTPLLGRIPFGESVAAIGDAMESLPWAHDSLHKKSLQTAKEPETTT